MDIAQKRDLMAAVEILCVRPGDATAETLAHALNGFQELIKHTTKNTIVVVYAFGEGS